MLAEASRISKQLWREWRWEAVVVQELYETRQTQMFRTGKMYKFYPRNSV